jgi:predicted N-acetyltransferase YhbS
VSPSVGGGIRIRPAAREDLPRLIELLGELHDRGGDEAVARRASDTWEQILASSGRTVLVAEDGGELVGSADLVVVPNLTHDAAPWAIVENVVVADARRRQGMGRALMEEAVARARAAGCYKVQLLSRLDRAGAHDFYRALGFERLAEGFRLYL